MEARVRAAERRGQLPVARHREQQPRADEDRAAECPARREQRAERDDRGSGDAHEAETRVGERLARAREARQRADAHDLDHDVEQRRDRDCREERERQIARRILELAARHHHRFESGVREDQLQHRARERAGTGKRGRREVPGREEEDPDPGEQQEWQQLSDRERGEQPRGVTHADHVHDGEPRDHGADRGDAPRARGGRRPEEREVVRHHRRDRRDPGDARHPHQPADHERGERAESGERVEIRSPGRVEPARDLGEREPDAQDDERAREVDEQPPHADERVHPGRQAENPRPDDPVDHQRNERPAADAADQAGVGSRATAKGRIGIRAQAGGPCVAIVVPPAARPDRAAAPRRARSSASGWRWSE